MIEIVAPKKIVVIDPFDPDEAPDANTAYLSDGPKVLLPDDDRLLRADAEEDDDDLDD